ncbi:MAG: type II toxin-antitoxin system VapC family toxin [Vicinamibacterales bacterium]
MPAVLVDAGPLIALIEPTDRHHRRAVATLKTLRGPLVTVWPAFTEAMYLLRDSARSQEALWGIVSSGALDFAALGSGDVPRLSALMRHYRDQPMDLADAALVHVAEREGIAHVFTFDRRHFAVYRLHGRRAFAVLP